MVFDNSSFKSNRVNYTPNCLFFTINDNPYYAILAHRSFKNLEEKHAEVVAQNKGNILEIGFGLGVSANKFLELGVGSYTCIEINDIIYQHALEWAKDKPNVTIIHGSWDDIIPTLTTKYDGIYYCSSTISHSQFYETCKSINKPGTIISSQGYIYDLPSHKANIEDNVSPPHFYDEFFTKEMYNSLVDKQYYKVYWNIFDGTNYVKCLQK